MNNVGGLSQNNMEIVSDHGQQVYNESKLDKIYKGRPYDAPNSQTTWLGKVCSFFNLRTAGEYLGYAVGVTHGAQATASVVDRFTNWYFSNQAPGWGLQALKEGMKLGLTPYVQPFIVAGMMATGGAIGAAAAAGISGLYTLYRSTRPKDLSLRNITDVSQMAKVEGENIVIGKGVHTVHDFHQIVESTSEYAICRDLMALQSKSEIKAYLLDRYIGIRLEDNKKVLADGYVLSQDEYKEVVAAAANLVDANNSNQKEAIHKTIKLFAKHTTLLTTNMLLQSKNATVEDYMIVRCSDNQAAYIRTRKGYEKLTQQDMALLSVSVGKKVAAARGMDVKSLTNEELAHIGKLHEENARYQAHRVSKLITGESLLESIK